MKPQLLASSVLLALSAWALPAHALGNLADVTVIDRNTGATLPLYFYGGDYWVAGQSGARYAIAVNNKLGERVLAVTAVDGVNVLSGQTAAWDQTGYVFSAGQQYQMTGWRKSNSEVAAFEFSALKDSYASRTGRPTNVGVIGVAIFKERLPEPVVQAAPASPGRNERQAEPPGNLRSLRNLPRSSASAEPSAEPPIAGKSALADRVNGAEEASAFASAPAPNSAESRPPANPLPASKLGTGHGARESSAASQTGFARRQAQPDEVIRIRYDSRENLIASGVIRETAAQGPASNPEAFPQSGNVSYVPDPPRN